MPGEARTIVSVRAGAHLYGNATPDSDLDIRSVFLPAARDILLQRVAPAISEQRELSAGTDGKIVDTEAYSLQRFLTLLISGRPVAIEMIFAPDASMREPPDSLWREVQALGPRLLSRSADAFLRYCRQQAEQYGARGRRVEAARQALAVLAEAEARHGRRARLEVAAAELATLAEASVDVTLVDVIQQDKRAVRHLEVCGRRVPLPATIGAARAMVERLAAGYGERAHAAGRLGGVDWKALSHSVRVGYEAIELFTTGRLSFPLASAERLLAIKLGRVPYREVAEDIETLPAKVEQAAAASALPEVPDLAAAEELTLRAYRSQVLASAA